MKETSPEKREEAAVEIFYFLIIPVLLLYFNIVANGTRMYLLLFVCLLIYAVVRNENWSAKRLGMLKPSGETVFAYILFTILMVAGLLLIVHFLGHQPERGWWEDPKLLLLFIPSSFLQEFAFRSFLMPLLEDIFKWPWLIIAVNALLFGFLHIIFEPLALSVSLALSSGVAFAWMYYKYPNYWLISISHSILNFLAILFGFFLIK